MKNVNFLTISLSSQIIKTRYKLPQNQQQQQQQSNKQTNTNLIKTMHNTHQNNTKRTTTNSNKITNNRSNQSLNSKNQGLINASLHCFGFEKVINTMKKNTNEGDINRKILINKKKKSESEKLLTIYRGRQKKFREIFI